MGRVAFNDHVEERTIDEIEEEPTNIYEYQNTPDNKSWAGALPLKQGLYDPELEKDACGVGFAAHIKGKVSHKIVIDGMSLYWFSRDNCDTDSAQHEACSAT